MQNIFVRSGLRLNEVHWPGEAFIQQVIVNQAIFPRRKNMLAQIQIVARMIDQLKREHSRIEARSRWPIRKYRPPSSPVKDR